MCIRDRLDEFGYKQYFQVFKGSLFKKVEGRERDWRLVIPEGLIDKIVWDCHYRYGHFGAKKCVSVLRESSIFKNMERRVRKILKTQYF